MKLVGRFALLVFGGAVLWVGCLAPAASNPPELISLSTVKSGRVTCFLRTDTHLAVQDTFGVPSSTIKRFVHAWNHSASKYPREEYGSVYVIDLVLSDGRTRSFELVGVRCKESKGASRDLNDLSIVADLDSVRRVNMLFTPQAHK